MQQDIYGVISKLLNIPYEAVQAVSNGISNITTPATTPMPQNQQFTQKQTNTPGFFPWQRANQQNLQGQNAPQQYNMYTQAVNAPGGHPYGVTPAVTNPSTQVPTQASTQAPSVMGAQTTPTQTPQSNVNTTNLFPNFTTTKVPSQYASLIYNSARQAGINPDIFASLLFSEHGFQPTGNGPVNSDGSYDRGMAQINSASHPDVSDAQANDPNYAVPYAANLLKHYISAVQSQGGTLAQGIAAYNVGVGGALSQGPGKLPPQGQNYINKIKHGVSSQLSNALGL